METERLSFKELAADKSDISKTHIIYMSVGMLYNLLLQNTAL